MTFSKMVPSVHNVTLYLEDANNPGKGFRLVVGNLNVKLSVEDAKDLAEYIWVRIPDVGEEEDN